MQKLIIPQILHIPIISLTCQSQFTLTQAVLYLRHCTICYRNWLIFSTQSRSRIISFTCLAWANGVILYFEISSRKLQLFRRIQFRNEQTKFFLASLQFVDQFTNQKQTDTQITVAIATNSFLSVCVVDRNHNTTARFAGRMCLLLDLHDDNEIF